MLLFPSSNLLLDVTLYLISTFLSQNARDDSDISTTWPYPPFIGFDIQVPKIEFFRLFKEVLSNLKRTLPSESEKTI